MGKTKLQPQVRGSSLTGGGAKPQQIMVVVVVMMMTLMEIGFFHAADLQRGSSSFQVDSISSANVGLRRHSVVPFVPEYSVRVVSDVQCVCITRSQYIAAVNATSLERRRPTNPVDSVSNDNYHLGWERYRQNGTEVLAGSGTSLSGRESSNANLGALETKLLQDYNVETNLSQNNKADPRLVPNSKAEADNTKIGPITSAHYSSMRLLSGIQDSGKPGF